MTPEQERAAIQMRRSGMSWQAVADAMGKSIEGLRRRVDPVYRDRRNKYQAGRERRIYHEKKGAPPRKKGRPKGRSTKPIVSAGWNEPRADRTVALYDPQRDGQLVPPDITGRLMGDPPPGRRELLERAFNTRSSCISMISAPLALTRMMSAKATISCSTWRTRRKA